MAEVTLTTNFAEIATALAAAQADIVAEVAEEIAAGARRRASARIEGTIIVDHESGALEATVGAGDRRSAIHAGFEEFGTVGRAAYPFMIPAVEEVRPRVAGIATKHIEQAARRSAA